MGVYFRERGGILFEKVYFLQRGVYVGIKGGVLSEKMGKPST